MHVLLGHRSQPLTRFREDQRDQFAGRAIVDWEGGGTLEQNVSSATYYYSHLMSKIVDSRT